MSLKCSLLGHRYDDTETRRDQTRDGTELVETVQEVKICARCGETLVISETTEVRTVTPEDSTPPPADGRASRPTGDGAGTRTTGAGGGRGGPAAGRADESGGRTISGADESGGPAAGRADESGGRTISGADESGGPGAGRADESGGPGAGRADESGGAPIGGTVDRALGGADDSDAVGEDAPPARKDDAVIIDEDGEEKPTPDWQGEDDETGIDEGWEPDLDPDSDPDPGEETGRPSGDRGETDPQEEGDTHERPGGRDKRGSSGGLTVPEGEFHCPECEFTTAVESSSLRAGDFCPECHRGALEHRAD